MTEQEWLASTDPSPMLELLESKASDRKLRLFPCVYCQWLWLTPSKRRAARMTRSWPIAGGRANTQEVAGSSIWFWGRSKSVADDQKVDELVAQIEAAFAEVKLTDGRGWRDVPSKIIDTNNASLCFFSPQAFQYYLPAYLIWVLWNYRTSGSFTVDSTIYSLNPESGDTRRFVLSKFSLLAKPQRMAITAFLEFMRDHSDGHADAEAAEDALDSWWRDNP
jgi:hypothetical protein